ncbi:protein FRIGIDA-ESSENTIAL 1-like isoform X2 [Hibiscus syriacus]|uniref:protein FRIGIDA-ESSENTIAL 1-like isoform X2 n=1 Tax=Hibiscus syriacus TaxID=106335 RepID=UPI0019208FD5|nr:protein FRIGIDA-ESSENTIAL 1-like isoform X2 [Hibiscus syriacus]
MSLSTSTAVSLVGIYDESRGASTAQREINSSDMEIDDEEGEEDLQGSSNRNDAANVLESRGHDGQLGSDSLSTPGDCGTRIPFKTLDAVEGSANFKFYSLPNELLTTQEEDRCTKYDSSKYSVSGKQPAKEKAIQEYTFGGKDAQAILERKTLEGYHDQHAEEVAVNEINSIPVGNHSGEGVQSGLGFEGKSKPRVVQTEDDKRRIRSRSAASQTRAGSLSPGNNSENKRPALICDFFSRGWCIKGSSCRFLHIKDEKKPEQQPEEGFRNAAERSKSPASTDTRPSSVVNKTGLSSQFFSERIFPLGHDENQRLHLFNETYKLPPLHHKDKSMGTSPSSQWFFASIDDVGPPKGVRQNGIGQNLSDDNYAKLASLGDKDTSSFRNSFIPESLSGSVTRLDNVYNENQSHCVSTSLPPLPLNYSSSACSLGAQKMLDNDIEHYTSRFSSLLQGCSPFSNSKSENLLVNDISRDPFPFSECRINFSSDDWEPSVPFQPSFFVTSGLSSPQSQYDPVRDSIDLSNAGERSLKFSFSNPGPSLLNVAYPQAYGDSTSTGPLIPEHNDDKRTASCQNEYHENLVNDNCYPSEKDSLTTDANDGTSVVEMQNGNLVKEEMSSVVSHVKDSSKAKKIDMDHDCRHRRGETRCKKDLEVDRVREKNEIDVELEHREDGDLRKESKAMRHFHAALVHLIKELLKPTWREGRLSKDAHNTIVKKAVDKVLGSIQPHQVPTTFESVEHYLSLSQPKIARLVEGYIDKYRKS